MGASPARADDVEKVPIEKGDELESSWFAMQTVVRRPFPQLTKPRILHLVALFEQSLRFFDLFDSI
jgi:hypothetical protein